jgi:thioredoxin 1
VYGGEMRRLASTLASFGLVISLLFAGCEEGENAAPSSNPTEPEVASAADPFVAVSEDVLRGQIQAALARARSGGKKVLLEFVADWCHDCREVVRVASAGPAAEILASDYEVVYVEVGRLDRHVELIQRYRVERIATLVVLDGQGERVAQTTLEPLSNHRPLTSAALAGWLRRPIDHWQNTSDEPSEEEQPPVFPAEIVEPETEG